MNTHGSRFFRKRTMVAALVAAGASPDDRARPHWVRVALALATHSPQRQSALREALGIPTQSMAQVLSNACVVGVVERCGYGLYQYKRGETTMAQDQPSRGAVYHLHWRGTRDGTQTGWYIQDYAGTELGRIEWRSGSILVVHNDGSLWRDCGISHGASFAAASDLAEHCHAALASAEQPDFPT